MMKSFIFGAALVACAMADGPSLAVLKELGSDDVVEGRNLTVSVTVYNVGDGAAFNLELDDSQWTNIGAAPKKQSWSTVAPGASVVATYVIVPTKAGEVLSSKPAKVTYRTESGSVEVRVAYSNIVHDPQSLESVEGVPVISEAAFEKKSSRRTKEWLAFILLLVIPLGMPFFFFQTSTNSLKQKRAAAKKAEVAAVAAKKPASPVRKNSPTRK